jgi:hypothetical protein
LTRKLSFSTGCLFELALLVFAVLWGWLFHRPAFLDLNWSLNAAFIGIVAAIPPFAFFLWTLNSRLYVFSRQKQFMELLLRPRLGNWSILQLAIISICAGISEEAFFRGAVQGSLADRVGLSLALVLASMATGVMLRQHHCYRATILEESGFDHFDKEPVFFFAVMAFVSKIAEEPAKVSHIPAGNQTPSGQLFSHRLQRSQVLQQSIRVPASSIQYICSCCECSMEPRRVL